MKLTYWVADCLNDSKCYNLRAMTRKEIQSKRAEYDEGSFGPPRKIEVHYDNALDLVAQCLGEGNIEFNPGR